MIIFNFAYNIPDVIWQYYFQGRENYINVDDTATHLQNMNTLRLSLNNDSLYNLIFLFIHPHVNYANFSSAVIDPSNSSDALSCMLLRCILLNNNYKLLQDHIKNNSDTWRNDLKSIFSNYKETFKLICLSCRDTSILDFIAHNIDNAVLQELIAANNFEIFNYCKNLQVLYFLAKKVSKSQYDAMFASNNYHGFCSAAHDGNLPKLIFLLDYVKDDARFNMISSNNYSALKLAIYQNHPKILNKIIYYLTNEQIKQAFSHEDCILAQSAFTFNKEKFFSICIFANIDGFDVLAKNQTYKPNLISFIKWFKEQHRLYPQSKSRTLDAQILPKIVAYIEKNNLKDALKDEYEYFIRIIRPKEIFVGEFSIFRENDELLNPYNAMRVYHTPLT